MDTSISSIKMVLFNWGWGFLFLALLLLGEIFVNNNKNALIMAIGLVFLIFGVILVPVPFFLFPNKGKVQKGESFLHTTVIIDSGIYGLVRHPQYLGWAFIIFFLVLIKQHLIITVIGIIALFLLHISTLEEEKHLINKFGSDYLNYMKDVPMWNVLHGIVKRILRKKRFGENLCK